MTALERARAALAAEDLDAAISLALAVWRETRSTEVGRVITWLEAQRGVGAEQLASSPGSQLAELAALEPDPRVADDAITIIGKRRYATPEVYAAVFRVLMRHGDRRHAERLREKGLRRVVLRIPIALADLLPGIALRIERQCPRADEDREWAALIPTPAHLRAASQRSAESILASVYADPDNDELRAVCADRLQELGNPRGEFIAAQLCEPQTGESLERARELLETYRDEWLGPTLSEILRAVEFERGFLARATLARDHSAPGRVWQQALRDPQLSTLVILHRGRSSRWRHELFLETLRRTGTLR